MTSFARVFKQRKSIVDEYYTMIDDAEENRERESKAALIIQCCWRGYCVRKEMLFLNSKATTIQSVWRMYRDTNNVRIIRTQRATNARRLYFNQQATKIQRVWRGYWERTQVFDFYKQQQFLTKQAIKNTEMAQMLENYNAMTNDYDAEKEEEREIMEREDYAMKNHHLVSTSNIPSVFTAKPFTKENKVQQAMEQYIRSINRARIVVPAISPR